MFSENFKTYTNKFINWAFDLLFPKFCLGCGKEGFYVCPNCFTTIPIARNVYCFICNRRSPSGRLCPKCKKKSHSALAGLLIASDWQCLLLRQMIYEYKYRFIKDLAQPLGEILMKFIIGNWKLPSPRARAEGKIGNSILIPVPLHKRRQIWRGFNQAELLAQAVGHYFNVSVRTDILQRAHHTLPQMDIKDFKERQENIKQAFCLNQSFSIPLPQIIKGKIIILIDDISTTGSTLEECAKVLKNLKPKEIWGLVLARG